MSPEVVRNLGWDLISGSAHAAVLGLIVLSVRSLLRRHLSPDWRMALGALVLVRLVWPWQVATPVSLFNVTASWLPPINAGSFPIEGWRWGIGIWIVGFAIRSGLCLADARRVHRWIQGSRSAEARLTALWNDTLRAGPESLRGVPIRQSPEVANPCLAGVFRPCLLVPSDLGCRFSPEEIRPMFLHEMAHLRRRDLWFNWILELVRMVHWFNPVIGHVLRRWREDREEACDVHALSAGSTDRLLYGRILLKCLGAGSTAEAGLSAVSWSGGSSAAPHSLVHQIRSIARFRPERRTWIVGVCTLLSVGLIGLTDPEPLPPRRIWLLKPETLSRVLPADWVKPAV